MTGNDVLIDMRRLADDENANAYKWQDSDWLAAINAALRQMRTQHPETRLQEDGSLYSDADSAKLSDTLSLDSWYRQPLVFYACYLFFSSDGADTHDETRAQDMFTQYQAWFGGAG